MEFIDFGALIPVVAIIASLGFAIVWLRYHELKLKHREIELKAAEQTGERRVVDQRLAVLERIVTDRGLETADAIEALRNHPIASGEKVQ